MAIYTITGTATYSSQTFRDAARTRVNAAVAAYTFINVGTTFTAGINNPTTTTMTVSIQLDTTNDALVRDVRRAIYDAWTSLNRPTSCWLSSNKVT